MAGGYMLRLIERSIEALGHDLLLLAPPQATLPAAFEHQTFDSRRYQSLIHDMQRLRGSIYLREGNIRATQLTRDGRHETAEDQRGWHVLMLDSEGRVSACALYLEYANTVAALDTRVRHCPLLEDTEWGSRTVRAVEHEIERARAAGLGFAELGGWAIKPERRGSPDGIMMALATYALSRIRGGALGITTANVQHSCSSILRRLGGWSLECDGSEIPPYFDPRYNTEIELLRFDSRTPNTKYAGLIDVVREKLSEVMVVSPRVAVEASLGYRELTESAVMVA
jgi:hypothetical protein